MLGARVVMNKRVPIQIALTEGIAGTPYLVSLCNDGSMWYTIKSPGGWFNWGRIQDIPQPEQNNNPEQTKNKE
jgi:hypothetical protein